MTFEIISEVLPGGIILGLILLNFHFYIELREIKELLSEILDAPSWPEAKLLLKGLVREE